MTKYNFLLATGLLSLINLNTMGCVHDKPLETKSDDLAAHLPPPPQPSERNNQTVIELFDNEKVSVRGVEGTFAVEDIASALQGRDANDIYAVIKAEGNVSYTSIAALVEQLKRLGIRRIALMNAPK